MTATATKIPGLRFPEFDGKWEERKIEGSIDLLTGYPFKGEEISDEKGGVPLLRGINITEGFIRHSDEIDRYYHGELNGLERFLLNPGDLVLGMDGSKVGKNSAILDEMNSGALLVQRVARIRAKTNSSLSFIFHHINSIKFHDYVAKVNTSSGIPHISPKQIKDFRIYFPTLPEQQKIAAFLTTIDTRIQQLSRKKALLEQYKKGVMQQIFSQEIRFKDEEGKEFPAWEEKQLGAVFTFCQTNSLSRSLLNYERGAVKNIHYGDIHTKFPTIFDLSKEEVPFINESVDLSKIADENYCKVGDLIIADASEDYKDVGKAIEVVNLAGYKLLAGLHTLIVRDVKNQTVTGFKGYMMQTYNVRQQIMRLATGISVLGISKGNLSKVKLLLPSPPEQQKIAAFLSALDRQINLVSQQLERMQIFKKGLLQQMFV